MFWDYFPDEVLNLKKIEEEYDSASVSNLI